MLLTELQTYSLTHMANVPFSSASSGDNSFSFITEKGLDILEMAPDPKSVSPSLSCRRYVIRSSGDLPTSDLGILPKDILPHLDRELAYSLISDITLSPSLTRTLSPVPVPRLSQWSPVGILPNHRCVLAVLTDMGSLCLYMMADNEYQQKTDISKLWLRECRLTWGSQPRDYVQRLAELRHRAEMVKITGMCWMEETQGGAGWLATASKSGLVSLWQVRVSVTNPLDLDVFLVTQFNSELKIVTTLHWIPLSSGNSLLTAASWDGRLRCFTLSPAPIPGAPPPDAPPIASVPAVLSTYELWTEQDKIAVAHMTSWPWQDGMLLLAVKGAFIIAFYLDRDGEQRCYCAYRSCDTSINGLSQLSTDEILIATRSSRFTRLSVSLACDGKLKLGSDNVESYINISHMGCYGFNTTRNRVICFILLSVNQSYDHLRLREPTQVVVCSLSGQLEPQTVLQEPHRPISQLWDCLELLRVQMLQKTVVAQLSYTRSALDNMTIDQLTSTLWWLTFATASEDDEQKHSSLSQLRCEVEMLVTSCHFFKRISTLLGSPPDSLSTFQLQSLGLLHKWLTKLQNLPEEFATTLITGKTLLQQLEALEHKVPSKEFCSICGNEVSELRELFYSECSEGHRLPRCSLSLVQCCQLPYFICAQCGALAHPVAVEECGIICNLCGGVLRVDEEIL
uniref:Transcription factor IIIC 90kDa subunit N-terminal domain-containing protein n=1 Tax=Graphocephala atropunctata TaxID=36148 RepID=A0A1B6MNN9_9HEMI